MAEYLHRQFSKENIQMAIKHMKICSTMLAVATAAAKSLQSCNPIEGSPPGSPSSGILQARTLEWVVISFSNAWKWKVKVRSLSRAVRKMQIKSTIMRHLTPVNGQHQMSANSIYFRGCREKGTLLFCCWTCKLVQPLSESSMKIPYKAKNSYHMNSYKIKNIKYKNSFIS